MEYTYIHFSLDILSWRRSWRPVGVPYRHQLLWRVVAANQAMKYARGFEEVYAQLSSTFSAGLRILLRVLSRSLLFFWMG